MRGAWRLHQARHWLQTRIGSPALILTYHRVIELPSDPHLLAVSPERFAEHMKALRQYGNPVHLQELVRALQQRRMPKRAVVVTLDDGYADNLHGAKPVLAHHGVPATVFVATGHLSAHREFWWDELDRLLLQPGTLPPVLQLHVNGSLREWRLGEGTYTEEQYRRDRHWHVECGEDPGPRQQVFRALFDLLYLLPSAEKRSILDNLAAFVGAHHVARATHRTLTSDEAMRLAEGDVVSIGAHTVSHPVLAALSPAEQREEIRESKAKLEALLGREVTSFAYPHGSTTPEAVAAVRDAGFTCACSSEAAVLFRRADRFRLPRLCTRNWDGETFTRWLRWWIGA